MTNNTITSKINEFYKEYALLLTNNMTDFLLKGYSCTIEEFNRKIKNRLENKQTFITEKELNDLKDKYFTKEELIQIQTSPECKELIEEHNTFMYNSITDTFKDITTSKPLSLFIEMFKQTKIL